MTTLNPDGVKLWDWQPRYNIAPGTVIPVVAFNGGKFRTIVPMRWGLHPSWREEPPEGRPLFNARVETAAEKPSFRTPFKRRRTLIPTTGWYEWESVEQPDGKTVKTPHFIFEDSEDVGNETFALAGLWDRWRVDEGIELLSCTILTQPASGDVKHIHHRMPVRLPESRWNDWLDWDVRAERVLEAARDGSDLGHYEVSRDVNSGRATGPDLIRPYVAL